MCYNAYLQQFKTNTTHMEQVKNKTIDIPRKKNKEEREHTEFHNAYTELSIKDDIAFLGVVYKDKVKFKEEDVNDEFIHNLKGLGKEIYFFIHSLGTDITPQIYIKRKYQFIETKIPNACHQLFYLAWNGLIKNDSFKKLLRQKFSLSPFNDALTPNNIPFMGSSFTRYRNKMVLADDMAKDQDGNRRTEGRELDDGSGLKMREKIVWFPNGKAMPIFPQGYVPLNQTQVILIRHGKSVQESGGDNPKFVGSGYRDSWKDNRRISGSIGNQLKEDGIHTAQELGRDFKVATDILAEEGYPLWSWSKDTPVLVYGSESENTEQTARYFLQEAGYTNISFNAIYGLNSQKYGALTHLYKNEIFNETINVVKRNLGKTKAEKLKTIKAEFKNRFYHYPEGETLIEADWRIAYSFVDLLKKNQGKRILLADHSGAIRVFTAIIKTLDFADYASLKEKQDSIMALNYQPGKNIRYDYLQRADFPLRVKSKNK
jgi:broad specificity phosphatase PhoE